MTDHFRKAATASAMTGAVLAAGEAAASVGRGSRQADQNQEQYIAEQVPGQGQDICYMSGNKGRFIQENGTQTV